MTYLSLNFLLIVVISIAKPCFISGASLNDIVRKCPRGDVACGKSTAQELVQVFVQGIPELGLPVLDPYVFTNLTIEENTFTLRSFNPKLYGFATTIIDEFDLDLDDKKEMAIKFHRRLLATSIYDIKGTLGMFPINGRGELNVTMENLAIKIVIPLDIKTKNGKEYIVTRDMKYSFEFKDGGNFKIKNLVEGRDEISRATLKALNDNWIEMATELSVPFVKILTRFFYNHIKTFFSMVPLEKLVE